ncbi:MAG: tetratricopeptide repeat protein [Candidatus Thiodiazotropha sp. (ex Epidulcina cf. delphinae)]|nr:tetratricopeptide repeat protein [Candidatus Thiodiazotropha sp. (ex Epidulcina cf. delphinae)]
MTNRTAAFLLCLCFTCPAHAHSDIDDRIGEVNRRIAEQPEDSATYVRRAYLRAEHGEWQKAFADLDRATELSGRPDTMAFDRALLLHRWSRHGGDAGLQHRALRQVNRFLAIRPEDGDAFLLRARLHRDLERKESALADYTQSIAITEDPRADLFIEQAEMLDEMGREEEAVKVLQQSIGRLGVAALPVVRTAIRLEVRRGRADAALRWFERLPPMLKILPNELMLKGDLLREAGHPEQARRIYCEVLERLAGFSSWRRRQPAFADLEPDLSERLDRPCATASVQFAP